MEQSSFKLIKNPNKTRNRIPLASERKTLQFALQTKLNNQTYLDGMIKSTEEKQHGLEMHRRSLLEELEANASEISSLNECKAAAIAQKNSLEPSINELKGLLHPIRSCPDDILGEIFHVAKEDFKEVDSLPCVVTLSHVCQRWRKIALGTPSLWSHIGITIKAKCYEQQNQRLPEFWDSILPRLGNCPVKVFLGAQYKYPPAGGDISHLVPLNKILNLNTVVLQLNGAGACADGIKLFQKLTKPINYVELSLFPSGIYDLRHILSRTDSLKLKIKKPEVQITESPQQCNNLKYLALMLPRKFNVSNILHLCLNVERLTIDHYETEFEDSTLQSTACIFPNLQVLYATSVIIQKTILDPSSSCPKLSSIGCLGGFGTRFLDFLRRHPQICSISIDHHDDLLMALTAAPNVTSLTTGWELECISTLYSWERYGIDQCPFPKMDRLIVDSRVSLLPNSTEQILNRRAMGPGFEPLHAQGIVPLRVLKFKQDRESDKEWLENPTLEFAKVVHIEDKDDPNSLIYTISWPKITEKN